MCVYLSACTDAAPTGRIFLKSVWDIIENLSKDTNFLEIWQKHQKLYMNTYALCGWQRHA